MTQLKKLFAFGDSYTFGHELEDCPTNDFKTPSQLSYPALVAKKLGLCYECFAVGSFANNAITRQLTETLDDISNDDMVLIMWTHPHRREFLFDGDFGYRSVSPSSVDVPFYKEYYKHIDSSLNYHVNLSLYDILVAQYLLESKKINYVFLAADSDLSLSVATNMHGTSTLVNQINLDNWLMFDGNVGFCEWAKNDLKLKFYVHPPELAHEELSNILINRMSQ